MCILFTCYVCVYAYVRIHVYVYVCVYAQSANVLQVVRYAYDNLKVYDQLFVAHGDNIHYARIIKYINTGDHISLFMMRVFRTLS